MEANDRQPKFWSNAQTYMMAAICLVLGAGLGYLVHTPSCSDFQSRRLRS